MTATQKNISDFQDGYRAGWEAERQARGLDQGFAFEGPAPWPDKGPVTFRQVGSEAQS